MTTGKALFATVCASLVATQVQAQDRPDIQIPSGVSSVPVELLPPGARALGLAGAFTAVADDATAAEANPAGLTILSAPEVSLHYRDSDYSLEFYDAEARNSQFFGGPTGTLIKDYEDSQSNIAFASVVYPWERFVFSAFYTNNLDIDASAGSERVFDQQFVDGFTSTNALRGEFEAFGISTAFRINDMISVGLTVKRAELTLATIDRMVFEDFLDAEFALAQSGAGTPGDFGGVVDDVITVASNLGGDDTDTTYNLGILFNPAGNFSAGLVYKRGGEYDISGTALFEQRFGCTGSGVLFDICQQGIAGIDLSDFNRSMVMPISTRVDIPDTLTLGLAWRPGADDTWLLSFDMANIDYSDLPPPRRTTLGLELPVDGSNQAIADDIEGISDAVTYHLGVEKVFFPNVEWLTALTVRAGAFTDDDHDGTRLTNSDDTHGTLGFGAVFGANFQVDIAGEFSDRVDNIVLSAIYRFD